MKKIFSFLIACLFAFQSFADEGMWLPYLLGQETYNNMVKRGLKLTKEQLYSINKPSVKDAIVIFGGGCTGEIVSDKGLLFTNHHCGYNNIANASTVEHNYLKDGFYAKSMKEEIPSEGLSVKFLDKVVDVTDQFLPKLKGLAGAERQNKGSEIARELIDKSTNQAAGLEANIIPFYKGNQYLLFVYKVYKDVRLVAAPPENIGKFGGDTDNWEWPRHTGDFSVFRVYMSPEGNPAAYSPNNVPYKPKHFLPVSIKGVKEGDYAMIYGYPGGTNRYETSYGVKLKNDIENPTLVSLRDTRLKLMMNEMKKDAATKLKLASSYAGIANYWKFFDGESKQLKKHNVYNVKQAQEQQFITWAKNKPEYKDIFTDYKTAYEQWTPYAKQRVYYTEGIMGAPVARYSNMLSGFEKALAENNTEEINKLKTSLDRVRKGFIAEEDIPSDKNILAATAQLYYNDVDKSQQPTEFYNWLQTKYGALDDAVTYKKWANDAFESSLLINDAKWNAFIQNPTMAQLNSDLVYQYVRAFGRYYQEQVAPKYAAFNNKISDLGRLYIKGSQEMNPKANIYPDANFSMRLSYGTVQSYTPRDAVFYNYATTMKGVLEKYVPGDYEFDLAQKQIDLYTKKDFGQYKDPKFNDVVVGFITNNDITGGNSGSPVLNAKGELIGLAFDGNYEALSHKIAFDKDLNRTINVDIRYVLWVIEKMGGAKNIINELKIVR
ncbi:S46 family peptidase [Haoranjiania flava]|uniref:Dipeptidyl-peptidase n=1 Tax=Haoranjiania flava TaxID=1856322 RepID=A0AAE3LQV7_9BACT|nr:S46 family peptidase [Haoranjiania flava]MCU7694845.1 S46 family peptidase [Haoranjiania flava]